MFRPVQLVVLGAKGKFWFIDRGSYSNGRAVKTLSGHSSVVLASCGILDKVLVLVFFHALKVAKPGFWFRGWF